MTRSGAHRGGRNDFYALLRIIMKKMTTSRINTIAPIPIYTLGLLSCLGGGTVGFGVELAGDSEELGRYGRVR